MKLIPGIPFLYALLLAACPGFAQPAPSDPPPAPLNQVTADNQEAGRPRVPELLWKNHRHLFQGTILTSVMDGET